MERYIVRFKGKGELPSGDVQRIRDLPETRVIDSSPRMLLVESPRSVLEPLIRSLADWTMSAEQFVPVPDPRPKLRQG